MAMFQNDRPIQLQQSYVPSWNGKFPLTLYNKNY